jgi:hypothetical protein
MSVELLDMKEYQCNDYLQKHNIELVEGVKITGYCTVETEIEYEADSLTVIMMIFKRFDGVRQAVKLDDVIKAEQKCIEFRSWYLRQFRMINVEFSFDDNDRVSSYKYIDDYDPADYIPTDVSIQNYILRVPQRNYRDRITVQEVGLTSEQLEKVKSKATMIGAECIVADYNTLAVINKDKILVYSMQKRVDISGANRLLDVVFTKNK